MSYSNIRYQPKGVKGGDRKAPLFHCAHSGTGTGVVSGPGVSSFGLSLTGAGVVGAGVGSGLTGGVTTTGSSAFLSSTYARRHGSQMEPLPEIT